MVRRGAKALGVVAAFAAGVITALILPRALLVGILAVIIIYFCRTGERRG